jgi:hypothetical protein
VFEYQLDVLSAKSCLLFPALQILRQRPVPSSILVGIFFLAAVDDDRLLNWCSHGPIDHVVLGEVGNSLSVKAKRSSSTRLRTKYSCGQSGIVWANVHLSRLMRSRSSGASLILSNLQRLIGRAFWCSSRKLIEGMSDERNLIDNASDYGSLLFAAGDV